MTVAEQLASFTKFVEERLGGDEPPESLDELYGDWRALRPRPGDLEAIREALADLDAGVPGIPYDEFIEEFCAERGIDRDRLSGLR